MHGPLGHCPRPEARGHVTLLSFNFMNVLRSFSIHLWPAVGDGRTMLKLTLSLSRAVLGRRSAAGGNVRIRSGLSRARGYFFGAELTKKSEPLPAPRLFPAPLT
jgi:hypothetical protein